MDEVHVHFSVHSVPTYNVTKLVTILRKAKIESFLSNLAVEKMFRSYAEPVAECNRVSLSDYAGGEYKGARFSLLGEAVTLPHNSRAG